MAYEYEGVTVLESSDLGGSRSLLQKAAIALYESGTPLEDFRSVLGLSDRDLLALYYGLRASLRPIQVIPRTHRYVWLGSGRGGGKTHAVAVDAIQQCLEDKHTRGLIVGATLNNIRDVIINGPSGIATLAPPWFRPTHLEQKKQLIWRNGARLTYHPVESGGAVLKGKGFNYIVCDDLAAWRPGFNSQSVLRELYEVLRYRTPRMKKLGLDGRMIYSSTVDVDPDLLEMVFAPSRKAQTLILTSDSRENASHLDRARMSEADRDAHTSLGDVLVRGVFKKREATGVFAHVDFSKCRVAPKDLPARFDKIVIGLDPSLGGEDARGRVDETGLVVCGVSYVETEPGVMSPRFVVLADHSSKFPSSPEWARALSTLFHEVKGGADECYILCERLGKRGTMTAIITSLDPSLPVYELDASESKNARATPTALAYEKGDIQHVPGLAALEKELKAFHGRANGQDGRVDALSHIVGYETGSIRSAR